MDLSFAAELTRLCSVDLISEPSLEGGRATTRFQTPKDIGEMAAFLASDRAENIIGAAFNASRSPPREGFFAVLVDFGGCSSRGKDTVATPGGMV